MTAAGAAPPRGAADSNAAANAAAAAAPSPAASAAAAAQPHPPPPPPRETVKRSRRGAPPPPEPAELTRAQAAASAAAASAAAAAAAAPQRWSTVLSDSQSYGPLDPSFPYEVQEDRPTFRRFLGEHFRALHPPDLLKVALWMAVRGRPGQSQRPVAPKHAVTSGQLQAGTMTRSPLTLPNVPPASLKAPPIAAAAAAASSAASTTAGASSAACSSTSKNGSATLPSSLSSSSLASSLAAAAAAVQPSTSSFHVSLGLSPGPGGSGARSATSSSCVSPMPFDASSSSGSGGGGSGGSSLTSPFVSPSPLIHEPKTDLSFIVPPLGMLRPISSAASLASPTARSPSPVLPAASASTASSASSGSATATVPAAAEWADKFGPCYLPSIANEPALLLQLGMTPSTADIDELQQLVTDAGRKATPASAGGSSTSAAPAAGSAVPAPAASKSTSVMVLLSNNFTGRRPSRPSTPSTPRTHSNADSTPSTPSATAAGPLHSFGMSFSLGSGGAHVATPVPAGSLEHVQEGGDPQHILCEYVLTTAPAAQTASATAASPLSLPSPAVTTAAAASSSSVTEAGSSSASSSTAFSFTLSTLHATNAVPSCAALASACWPEVEALAAASEEQLEASRRKRKREAEAEAKRREEAEERRRVELEIQATSKKSAAVVAASMAAAAAAAAAVAAAAATASSTPAVDGAQSTPSSSPGPQRMEIDGESEPVPNVKLEPQDPHDPAVLDINTADALALAVKESPPSSVSPLTLSRMSTPAPSDPDSLLKELLSLQLQLAHQVAASAQHRRAIVKRIRSSDLQSYRAKQDEAEKYVLAAYQRVSRWQSIRLSMKRGTGDVLLPPALVAYHRHKYSYDSDTAESQSQADGGGGSGGDVLALVSNSQGEVFLDTSASVFNVPKSELELERDLATEAYERDDYSVCSVCFATGPSLASLSEDDQSVDNTNPLVFCERCNVCVHLFCYGIPAAPDEGEWVCQWCQAHPESDKPPTTQSVPLKRAATMVTLSPPVVTAPNMLLPTGAALSAPLVPSMLNPFMAPQAGAGLLSSFFPSLAPMGLPAPLPMPGFIPAPVNVAAASAPVRKGGDTDSSSSGSKSVPMDVGVGAALAVGTGFDPVASPTSSPSPSALSATSTSTSRSHSKKQTAADKARKKQKERESAADTERIRIEAERLREASKRAERRQREEELPLPCCLCTVRGGALKPTDEMDVDVEGYMQHRRMTRGVAAGPPQRLWAHIVCALWLPRTTVDDVATMSPIKGVRDAWKFRFFKHGLPPTGLAAGSAPQTNGTDKGSGSSAPASSATLSASSTATATAAAPPNAFATNAFALNSLSNLHMLSNMNPLTLMSNLNHSTAGPSTTSPPFGSFNTGAAAPSMLGLGGFNALSPSFNPMAGLMGGMNSFNAAAPFNFQAMFATPAVAVAASPAVASAPSGSAVSTPAIASPPFQSLNASSGGMGSLLNFSNFGGGQQHVTPVNNFIRSTPTPANNFNTSPFLLPLPPLPISMPSFNPLHSLNGGGGMGGGMSGLQAAQAINTIMQQQLVASTSPKLLTAAKTTSPPLMAASAATVLSPSNPLMMRATSLPLPSSGSPLLPPSAVPAGMAPPFASLNVGAPLLPFSAPLLPASSTPPLSFNTSVPPKPAMHQSGVCALCKKAYGCCVYCSADLCSQSYHPLCAWYAGLYMRVETGSVATDVRYFMYCSMHTPLKALAIELIEEPKDEKAAAAEKDADVKMKDGATDAPAPKKVRFEDGAAPAADSSSAPRSSATASPADSEPTYFPLVSLRLDPTSAASVSAFVSLFSYRNKVRLLQQREYRNRGRQEQTKKAKMQRKKRRLRLYGPLLAQSTHTAPDGTPIVSRRQHVRTTADGTPIFDRSTRGESKLHPREDQYELGRCAVCFETDAEIRGRARWEAAKAQRDWIAQCREAVQLGFAPPPRPAPPAPVQPTTTPGANRRKSQAAAAAAAAIPPHVAAFHASNPLLRCCECEIEVHSRCYGVQYEEVQAQLQAQERRKLKLQRAVKLGNGKPATSGTGSSATIPFPPFSALALQQELDELQQQFEDELAEELEEAEENTTQWRCRRCADKDAKDISCALCARKGGAFKRTDTDSWVHLVCAQWIPELSFMDQYTLEPVTGLDEISPARRRLKCYLCRRSGPCIECSEHTCSQAFHPLCGMLAGQLMLEIHDSANSSTFLSSCRRHTQLHLARFVPLPQPYTNEVWQKKKIDNSRVLIEVLKKREEDEATALEAAHEAQRKEWSDKRRLVVTAAASPPTSAASTPAPSPTSAARRRKNNSSSSSIANNMDMSGSGSASASASASPMPSPVPLMQPNALNWPNNAALMALDSIFPMSAAHFTLEFYKQLHQLTGGMGTGAGGMGSGSANDKNAANAAATAAAMAAAASHAASLAMMFPGAGMPMMPMGPAAGSGAGMGSHNTGASASSSPTTPSARRSASGASGSASGSASAASSPVPHSANAGATNGASAEEDDLPLSTILEHADSAAGGSGLSRSTSSNRRNAASGGAGTSARKRKTDEAQLADESKAGSSSSGSSKRTKGLPDTPHATLSAASAANAANQNKGKLGRMQSGRNMEEKEQR